MDGNFFGICGCLITFFNGYSHRDRYISFFLTYHTYFTFFKGFRIDRRRIPFCHCPHNVFDGNNIFSCINFHRHLSGLCDLNLRWGRFDGRIYNQGILGSNMERSLRFYSKVFPLYCYFYFCSNFRHTLCHTSNHCFFSILTVFCNRSDI